MLFELGVVVACAAAMCELLTCPSAASLAIGGHLPCRTRSQPGMMRWSHIMMDCATSSSLSFTQAGIQTLRSLPVSRPGFHDSEDLTINYNPST
eukprot:1307902-Rhodomonas_salina.2